MTHKQRVLSVIRGDELDYLPSHIAFASPQVMEKHAKFLGVPVEDLSEEIDNHLHYTYTLDQVFLYYREAPALDDAAAKGFARVDEKSHTVYDRWGVGWDTETEGVWPKYHPLASKPSLQGYKFPDPMDPNLLNVAEKDIKEYDNEWLVVCLGYINMFERAWFIRGFDNLMTDFVLHRRFAEDLLDRITEYQVERARRIVALGVSCGHTGGDYGSQRGLLLSPDLWRELIKPRLAMIWRVYKDSGLPVIHHCCGDLRKVLPDMIEIGLDVLDPVQSFAMSLDELAREYGKDITFFGGIDTQQLLPHGTPKEVEEGVKYCVETLGKHRRYIIAPSQEVMSDVPVENFRSMIEGIREYRTLLFG